MNTFTFQIILICFIIIIIGIIINNLYNNKENYENINIDIGNTLSDYYYNLVVSILEKKDFDYTDKSYYNNSNVTNNKNEFIKAFPHYIPFNETIYNEFLKNKININTIRRLVGVAFWGVNKSELGKIHIIMKPVMNKIFNDTFVKLKLKKNVKYPIIHFRCADTPFIKHDMYFFQKYVFFKNALTEIESKIGKITNITILSCADHLSNKKDKAACTKYAELLKKELSNYNTEIKCNSNVDDFVSMFYAPAVISTISSFSFMAGYFGNGIFIEPNSGIEEESPELECGINYKGCNIPHNKVDDYHDINEVYKLLF